MFNHDGRLKISPLNLGTNIRSAHNTHGARCLSLCKKASKGNERHPNLREKSIADVVLLYILNSK